MPSSASSSGRGGDASASPTTSAATTSAPNGIMRMGSVPATLSPSSWARASVPLYAPLAPYQDFSASSRFLVPPAAFGNAAAAVAGGAHPPGRYSEPLSLRGSGLFLKLALGAGIGLGLVRDSSLTSFALYFALLLSALYFLIVRGEPFSLALVVESATSLQAKATAASAATTQVQQMQPFPTVQQPATPLNSPMHAAMPYAGLVAQPRMPIHAKPVTAPAPKASAAPSPPLSPQFAFPSPVTATASESSPSPSPVAEEVAAPIKASPEVVSVAPAAAVAPVAPIAVPVANSLPASTPAAAAVPRVPDENTPVVVAGATARFHTGDVPRSWMRAAGESYDVRHGPNYKRTGKKAPSKAALFEAVGVDVFGAPAGRIDHIAQYLQLPWIARKRDAAAAAAVAADPFTATAVQPAPPNDDPSVPGDLDPVTKADDHYEVDPAVLAVDDELGVPTLFIVNFQMPQYAPSMWSKVDDGEGFSILLYYQITAETRAEIRSGRLSGAVQLFKEFVANAHSFEYHSRFKAIPRIVNPSQVNVGMAVKSLIKMYNSKPFLTGPHCHQFIRGPGYMEADIDVHHFCLSARKGAYGLLDALSSLVVDIGFVIEAGRDNADEELPEQVLACGRVTHLEPLQAKPLQYFIDVGKKERAKRLAATQNA